jgi:hypothetical protein
MLDHLSVMVESVGHAEFGQVQARRFAAALNIDSGLYVRYRT